MNQDLNPVVNAINNATALGHQRPVVLALCAESARARAVHLHLEGEPMPVAPVADRGGVQLYFLVSPRESVAGALRQLLGSAGSWLADQLDTVVDLDGWFLVVRDDGVGYGGIRQGMAVLQGSRLFEAEARPGPAHLRAHRPGRRGRRGRNS